MIDPMQLIADEAGALSTEQICLCAAALLLLGIAAWELYDASIGSLLSSVDPGVAAFTAELDLASTQDSTD